jgi:hypothetical protein
MGKTNPKPQSKWFPQDIESVAKRRGCDPDLKAFDKKLGEIARTKPEK